jgi:hypothetical protein
MLYPYALNRVEFEHVKGFELKTNEREMNHTRNLHETRATVDTRAEKRRSTSGVPSGVYRLTVDLIRCSKKV